MVRRVAAVIMAFGCMAMMGSAQPPPERTKFVFKLFFDGGNAFVAPTSQPKTLTVGAVAHGTPAEHFNRHRMRLELEDGSHDAGVTTLKPFEVPETQFTFWDVHGWEIQVCPGGRCPAMGSLETSPPKISYGDCEDAPNNLALIPNFATLHPGKLVAADWRDRLESRLLLREGRLRVRAAKSCFDLQDRSTSMTVNVAGGPKEVFWELPIADDYVELKLTSLHKAGDRLIRLLPPNVSSGPLPELQMHVTTFQKYDDPKVGVEVPHFQQFYSLYPDIPPSDRFRLIARKIDRGATPGTECPPAYLLAP